MEAGMDDTEVEAGGKVSLPDPDGVDPFSR
jgi:hypothetical protein